MARNGTYDVAQICLNGHIINGSAKMDPIHNKDFCPKCGSKTITNCLNCNLWIEGDFYITLTNQFTGTQSLRTTGRFALPLFCPKCGVPFPWTEKKIEVSKNLISELSELTQEEKELLVKDVDIIIRDTPETIFSANRIKKILPKIGKVIRDLIVDISSETAKKIILPFSDN